MKLLVKMIFLSLIGINAFATTLINLNPNTTLQLKLGEGTQASRQIIPPYAHQKLKGVNTVRLTIHGKSHVSQWIEVNDTDACLITYTDSNAVSLRHCTFPLQHNN